MFKKIQKWGNPNKNCNISGKGMCQRNSCLSWLTNNKKRFLSFPSPHPFRHIPLLPSFVLSLNDFLLHCGHYGLLEGSCFISSLRSAGYRGKWRGALSPKRWGIIFLWQQVKETKQVDLGCTSSKVPAANTDYKGRTTEGAVITQIMGVEKKGTRISRAVQKMVSQEEEETFITCRPLLLRPWMMFTQLNANSPGLTCFVIQWSTGVNSWIPCVREMCAP